MTPSYVWINKNNVKMNNYQCGRTILQEESEGITKTKLLGMQLSAVLGNIPYQYVYNFIIELLQRLYCVRFLKVLGHGWQPWATSLKIQG